jgi:uncharacterized membrane protein
MSIGIRAPSGKVWSYLVDWEHLDRWMMEARDFKVTSEHREGVGVTAEATISIAGVTTRDSVRVSRWEPPTLLEIQHLGWVAGYGVMEAVPEWSGTRVMWKESLWPPLGLAGAIGLRAFKPLMRRVFEHDLTLLKQLVESDPTPD